MTALYTITRITRNDKKCQERVEFERIGDAPIPEAKINPFQLALYRYHTDRDCQLFPGQVKSEILNEIIKFDPQPPKMPQFRTVFIEQVHHRNFLRGDPIAALGLKGFTPEREWLEQLDRYQRCPFCNSHALLRRQEPQWSEVQQIAFVCLRRSCEFYILQRFRGNCLLDASQRYFNSPSASFAAFVPGNFSTIPRNTLR